MTKLVKNLIIGGTGTTVVAGSATGVILALPGKKSKATAPVTKVTSGSQVEESAKSSLALHIHELENAKNQLENLKSQLDLAKTPEQLKSVEEKVSEWVKNSSHLSPALEKAAKELVSAEITKENQFIEEQKFAAGSSTYNGFHNSNVNPRPENPAVPTPVESLTPSIVAQIPALSTSSPEIQKQISQITKGNNAEQVLPIIASKIAEQVAQVTKGNNAGQVQTDLNAIEQAIQEKEFERIQLEQEAKEAFQNAKPQVQTEVGTTDTWTPEGQVVAPIVFETPSLRTSVQAKLDKLTNAQHALEVEYEKQQLEQEAKEAFQNAKPQVQTEVGTTDTWTPEGQVVAPIVFETPSLRTNVQAKLDKLTNAQHALEVEYEKQQLEQEAKEALDKLNSNLGTIDTVVPVGEISLNVPELQKAPSWSPVAIPEIHPQKAPNLIVELPLTPPTSFTGERQQLVSSQQFAFAGAQSGAQLEHLAEVASQNPNLNGELRAHTDDLKKAETLVLDKALLESQRVAEINGRNLTAQFALAAEATARANAEMTKGNNAGQILSVISTDVANQVAQVTKGNNAGQVQPEIERVSHLQWGSKDIKTQARMNELQAQQKTDSLKLAETNRQYALAELAALHKQKEEATAEKILQEALDQEDTLRSRIAQAISEDKDNQAIAAYQAGQLTKGNNGPQVETQLALQALENKITNEVEKVNKKFAANNALQAQRLVQEVNKHAGNELGAKQTEEAEKRAQEIFAAGEFQKAVEASKNAAHQLEIAKELENLVKQQAVDLSVASSTGRQALQLVQEVNKHAGNELGAAQQFAEVASQNPNINTQAPVRHVLTEEETKTLDAKYFNDHIASQTPNGNPEAPVRHVLTEEETKTFDAKYFNDHVASQNPNINTQAPVRHVLTEEETKTLDVALASNQHAKHFAEVASQNPNLNGELRVHTDDLEKAETLALDHALDFSRISNENHGKDLEAQNAAKAIVEAKMSTVSESMSLALESAIADHNNALDHLAKVESGINEYVNQQNIAFATAQHANEVASQNPNLNGELRAHTDDLKKAETLALDKALAQNQERKAQEIFAAGEFQKAVEASKNAAHQLEIAKELENQVKQQAVDLSVASSTGRQALQLVQEVNKHAGNELGAAQHFAEVASQNPNINTQAPVRHVLTEEETKTLDATLASIQQAKHFADVASQNPNINTQAPTHATDLGKSTTDLLDGILQFSKESHAEQMAGTEHRDREKLVGEKLVADEINDHLLQTQTLGNEYEKHLQQVGQILAQREAIAEFARELEVEHKAEKERAKDVKKQGLIATNLENAQRQAELEALTTANSDHNNLVGQILAQREAELKARMDRATDALNRAFESALALHQRDVDYTKSLTDMYGSFNEKIATQNLVNPSLTDAEWQLKITQEKERVAVEIQKAVDNFQTNNTRRIEQLLAGGVKLTNEQINEFKRVTSNNVREGIARLISGQELSRILGPQVAALFNTPDIAGAKLFIDQNNKLNIVAVSTDNKTPNGNIAPARVDYHGPSREITSRSSVQDFSQAIATVLQSHSSYGKELTTIIKELVLKIARGEKVEISSTPIPNANALISNAIRNTFLPYAPGQDTHNKFGDIAHIAQRMIDQIQDRTIDRGKVNEIINTLINWWP